MFLETIAAKILVNAYKYHTEAEAVQGLRAEFKLHFPAYDYNDWNKDVPDHFAQNIITNVGKNGTVSVRFIIKDLETIAKHLG
jgi:hypothetical protein